MSGADAWIVWIVVAPLLGALRPASPAHGFQPPSAPRSTPPRPARSGTGLRHMTRAYNGNEFTP